MERICKNCRLFNERDQVCSVTVVIQGEKYELPVLPYDECHWERADREIQESLHEAIQDAPDHYFQQKLMEQLDTPIEVKQLRAWSDGKNGYLESPSE